MSESRAWRYWTHLPPDKRTVGALDVAVRSARVEATWLALRAAKMLPGDWSLSGVDEQTFKRELELCRAELRHYGAQLDKLAMVGGSRPVADLPTRFELVYRVIVDPAQRRAATANAAVITPLIDWPGRLAGELGVAEKMAAEQTIESAIAAIIEQAQETVVPTSSTLRTAAIVGAVAVGAVAVGAVAVALARSTR